MKATQAKQPVPAEPACPVCQSTDLRQWYPAGITRPEEVDFSYSFKPEHARTFRVVRCQSCTHAFCSPVPDNIAANYVDVVDEEYLKHEQSRRLAARALLSTLDKHASGRYLLDVGCATGDFLEEAIKVGYRAEGLELSSWSARLAEKRGLKIHRQYLSELVGSHAGRFDVVTLWGVIEHFNRPGDEVRHIQKLLKPGGILAIWTSDADSLSRRLLGRRWWNWQGQHIQYFTHQSLKRLAQECGLQHVNTSIYPFAASYDTVANSLRRYPIRPLILPLVRLLFAVRREWYLRLPGEMFFLARRPEQA
jgi:2-polyprenyl-3-methyl-5-hydroxy-6-metoxy-1,4-benzoquinol methylase